MYGRNFFRLRFAFNSFFRQYANFNYGQQTRFINRRNYRSKSHIIFAFSYAAVSSSTSDTDDIIDTRQVQCYDPLPDNIKELNWEKVVHDDTVCVYRRWISSLGVYEYRCAGTYTDISAKNFIRAQMDIEYRKEWDQNVIDVTILEKSEDGSEVLRWIHKFPRPLHARIYIYSRKASFDDTTQSMLVESQALTENEWPSESADKYYVRVSTYKSRLAVHAHSEFHKNGFEYVLTYYDSPRAAIPGAAYNWIVSHGGPYYLKEVHEAAKRLAD